MNHKKQRFFLLRNVLFPKPNAWQRLRFSSAQLLRCSCWRKLPVGQISLSVMYLARCHDVGGGKQWNFHDFFGLSSLVQFVFKNVVFAFLVMLLGVVFLVIWMLFVGIVVFTWKTNKPRKTSEGSCLVSWNDVQRFLIESCLQSFKPWMLLLKVEDYLQPNNSSPTSFRWFPNHLPALTSQAACSDLFPCPKLAGATRTKGRAGIQKRRCSCAIDLF